MLPTGNMWFGSMGSLARDIGLLYQGAACLGSGSATRIHMVSIPGFYLVGFKSTCCPKKV